MGWTMGRTTIVTVPFATVRAFTNAHHRHHRAPLSHRFSLGLESEGGLIQGVATVGRPMSRHLDARGWYEVTRLCVAAEVGRGECSQLYAACARKARGQAHVWAKESARTTEADSGRFGHTLKTAGLWRTSPVFIITYTLASESGASIRGAGWTEVRLPVNSSARKGRKADGPHKDGKPMTLCPLGPKRLWVFPLNGQARNALKAAGPTPHLHQLYTVDQ